MASFKFRIAFLAVALAGNVAATHIKKHRFPSHRTQCRPRLASPIQPISPSSVLPSAAERSSSFSIPAQAHHSASAPTTTTLGPSATTSTVRATSTTKAINLLSRSLTPNGIKAGIAGGDAYPYLKDHIGWWYDWSPDPSKPGEPIGVPMLWGNGTVDTQDKERLTAFEHLSTVPAYVLGYEEPDCTSGSGSADMTVQDGVSKWESLIAPLRKKGSKVGSPSMCKQADETWLSEFRDQISTPWDFTAIHINKNSLDGVKKDIDHYMKYGKPIWVTEFACVDDYQGFTPCTDQQEINNFINDIVVYMQGNSYIQAYAYSNGLGLGDVWPLMDGDSLSESGRTYLAAIEKYH